MNLHIKPMSVILILTGFYSFTIQAATLSPLGSSLPPASISSTALSSSLTLPPTLTTPIALSSGSPPPPAPVSFPGLVSSPISIIPLPPPPTGNPASQQSIYTAVFTVTNDLTNNGLTIQNSTATTQNFTTIMDALNHVPTGIYNGNSCTERYLVKVSPGSYIEKVVMKSCVDIEGWSEDSTRIASSGGSDLSSATVVGASHAELRLLTVMNNGRDQYAVAIFNDLGADLTLTHVTATAWDGIKNTIAIYNQGSSPTLTHVTANAYMTATPASLQGPSESVGVLNISSSPTLTHVIAKATHEGGQSIAVQNDSSTSVMNDVIALAPTGVGLDNHGPSFAVLQNSILRGGAYSLLNQATVTGTASQFDGTISNTGSMACKASYNGSYAPLNTMCQ